MLLHRTVPIIRLGVCAGGAARDVGEFKDGRGHFIASFLVKAVRGGEHGAKLNILLHMWSYSVHSVEHAAEHAPNVLTERDIDALCVLRHSQGVRTGKAGLWFYTGVTCVTLVRLLVMRSLAPEFGNATTPASVKTATTGTEIVKPR